MSAEILGSSPLFDRPLLAGLNLARGNVGAAGRAIYDPDSLSPEERKSLAASVGLEGSWLEPLVNVVSNPLFLAGMAGMMMTKFKFPLPQERMSFSGTWQKLKPRFAWMRFMAPAQERLHGTPIFRLLNAAQRQGFEGMAPFANELDEAFTVFQKKVGRYPTEQEFLDLQEALDRTFVLRTTAAGKERSHWHFLERELERLEKPRNAEKRARFIREMNMTPSEAADLMRGELANYKPREVGDLPGPLQDLAVSLRTSMDNIYNKIIGPNSDSGPHIRRSLLRRMGFEVSEANMDKVAEMITGYWVRVRKLPSELEGEHIRRFAEGMFTRDMTKQKNAFSVLQRTGAMGPDPAFIKARGFSDKFQQLSMFMSPRDGANLPVYYSMEVRENLPKYFNSLRVAYGWDVPPIHPEQGVRVPVSYRDQVVNSLEKLLTNAGPEERAAAEMVQNVIIPQMMGGMTSKQVQSATAWAGTKLAAINTIDKALTKGWDVGGVLQRTKSWLQADQTSSYPGLGHSITSYMNLATLGAPNLLTSGINLLQPMMGSGLPMRDLGLGYNRAAESLSKLFTAMLPSKLDGKGLTFDRALEAADRDFFKMFLQLQPAHQEALRNELSASLAKTQAGTGLYTAASRVKSAMMAPFQTTELFNRLATFHGFRSYGKRTLPGTKWWFPEAGHIGEAGATVLPKDAKHKLTQQAINQFAEEMTYQVNYGSGPLHRPSGLLEAWAPWTQFTSYPTRTASYIGAMATRHPEQLARVAAMSGLMYGMGREFFGNDLSRGLLFGGIPTPSEHGAFAPLPIVPPFLQLLGSGALSLASGDSEEFRRSLPLLVPGGVGLARALPNVPGIGEAVGTTIHRQYADYEKKTPDGRVPVYTGEGALVGYFTETQLWAKSIGLGDLNTQQEAELTKYLLGQRDAVRGLKQDFLKAMEQGDGPGMKWAQGEFERRYPGMGGLPIRKSDIRALHLKQDVTRLERVLETIPPEMRPQMSQAIQSGITANYPEFLGLQANGLSEATTISLREPYRRRTLGAMEQRVENSLHGVKMRDKVYENAQARTQVRGGYYGSTGWYPTTETNVPGE